MRNPNVRILVIAVVLIAAVAAAGLLMQGAGENAIPEANENTRAYLRVQAGSEIWPLIPLTDGGEYVVEQDNGCKNVIHTTQDSIVMHFSTCDNQNCIHQGVVSVDNRAGRVLGGMIVCLPNEVVLELLTPDEVQEGS